MLYNISKSHPTQQLRRGTGSWESMNNETDASCETTRTCRQLTMSHEPSSIHARRRRTSPELGKSSRL